ncbi:MAG TPA: tetratricopeptide repeat protein [Planctomycetota bacterium]|nr:tetratricopeptide repeat protein [Planctomycetota bacterium]
MWRRVVFVCLVVTAARAQEYERLLDDARRELADESVPMGVRLDAHYRKLGDAALAHPDRWEALFERGENRCRRAFYYRAETEMYLARERASGMGDAALRQEQVDAAAQVERWVLDAHHDFSLAEAAMVRRGEVDSNRLLFANAAMKFAGREYEQARGGATGAIADFRELVRRNFLPATCADHLALCYLDVGHAYSLAEKFEAAQQAWDQGLRWTQQAYLRQLLLTNKAGAYEMDHQYERAAEVLSEQIAGDPTNPAHHKNLGLVLGLQNRLKEALYHYRRARELCGGSADPRALFNGNAWLRAAVIHGTLLEHEGDIRLAWRLFLEYRRIFGDDYNFSLWFGDFAVALGQYDLAWRYLQHARDLQPRCPAPYQKLVQTAPRTTGTREEVEARTKEAARSLGDAKAQHKAEDENPTVLKICGGVADLGDLGVGAERAALLEPDPLEGLGPDHPPAWVEEAARARDPFVPFEPADAPPPPPPPKPPPVAGRPWALVGPAAGALLLAGVVALFLVFGKRKS